MSWAYGIWSRLWAAQKPCRDGEPAQTVDKNTERHEDIMYIIAGLGNPSSQYRGSRHNVGFEVIDRLADRYHIDVTAKKFKALTGNGVIEGQKVILVKPQTFMNLSGESLREVMNFYKTDISQLIVVYDDINLALGQLRIRGKGSAGGHNGMKNIILNCGSQDFPRVRLGVGEKPVGMDLADYVLSRFWGEEKRQIEEGFLEAADAVCMLLREGLEAAMNRYNQKK